MHIKQELLERNSLDEFKRDLGYCLSAGVGVIHVRTTEIQRTLRACRILAAELDTSYTEWDVVRGFTDYDITNAEDMMKPGDRHTQGFDGALETIMSDVLPMDTAKAPKFFVFTDPTPFWESPAALQDIRVCASALPLSDRSVILVTQDVPPPAELADLMGSVRMNPPGFSELMAMCEEILGEQSSFDFVGIDDEDVMASLCFAGAGMSENSFKDALSLAIIAEWKENSSSEVHITALIPRVSEQKTKIVNSNDILELFPSEDMSEVGGMENLKEWIESRKDCYSDAAAEMGVEPPKGVVLLGVPGTGKSLIAKAISSEFGVPLVRLDFGRVFNSLVGSSEQRIREALRMVEFMAPVVLLVDEIDKGLGGVAGGGGGDSGTSLRVFGTFLSWLQDNKAPVFCVVTANNIDQLPPELSRRGRFDNIFYTGLPDERERKEVAKIHLLKRGWEPFADKEMNIITDACAGFVHAEIEASIKDALINAYASKQDFTYDHVIEAMRLTIPLSKSYREQIVTMLAWCTQNASPASKKYQRVPDEGDSNVTPLNRSRRLRKRVEEKEEE